MEDADLVQPVNLTAVLCGSSYDFRVDNNVIGMMGTCDVFKQKKYGEKTMRVSTVLVDLGLLSACTDVGVQKENEEPNFVRVTDAATFKASFVDRRIQGPEKPEVWFRLNSDGSIDGDIGKGPAVGTWEFKDGYWCREFTSGVGKGTYDCQTIELAGNLGRFTRNRGNGDAGVFALKN